ncbi:DUF4381 family protein [Candidatus Dependentiae bacterium]|nr:DUF4381 family protein [Candidatus Dependentiae bacterium]
MEKAAELYPMYGFWKQPWWQTSWFFYVVSSIGFMLALGLLWLLARWYRQRKRKKTPWDLALARLTDLQLMVTKQPDIPSKEIYIRITIIIKNYLYSHYAFNVESKTDDELIVFLEQTSFDRALITILQEMVKNSTEAKFAKQQLDASIAVRDIQGCLQLIRKTIPQKH